MSYSHTDVSGSAKRAWGLTRVQKLRSAGNRHAASSRITVGLTKHSHGQHRLCWLPRLFGGRGANSQRLQNNQGKTHANESLLLLIVRWRVEVPQQERPGETPRGSALHLPPHTPRKSRGQCAKTPSRVANSVTGHCPSAARTTGQAWDMLVTAGRESAQCILGISHFLFWGGNVVLVIL